MDARRTGKIVVATLGQLMSSSGRLLANTSMLLMTGIRLGRWDLKITAGKWI